MPGPIIPIRRQRPDESDEETLASDGTSVSSGSGSLGSATKRARPNGAVRNPSSRGHRPDDPPLVHQPGTIVRVEMTNFVTYTKATFDLGPSLNMIIGPNGTGKSTLVCAICLGLGWSPAHLGRAKNVGEFVRHGCREAEIKIELASGPEHNGSNPVIQRTIQRDGNKTTWQVNKRAATHKDVLNLVRSYSIQIDNLCQFLPQDRVVEFAALSPVQLLDQTQRAAAPERMAECHSRLKDLGEEQKKLQADENMAREKLINLERRQESQRPEYERIRDRQTHQARLDLLERCRPRIQWKALKARCEQERRRANEAKREYRELEQETQPTLRALRAKEEYADQTDGIVKKRRKFADRFNDNAQDKYKRVAEMELEITECDRHSNRERENGANRRQETARIEQVISRLKKDMEKRPAEVNTAEYNEKTRGKTRQIRDLESALSSLEQSHRDTASSSVTRRRELDGLQARQEELKTKAGRQIQLLKNTSRDSARAWEWLQENGSLFEGKVYGPAIVECSVTDPKYAKLVEAALQRNDLLAFTCTAKADFNLLQKKLYGELKLKDVSVRTASDRSKFQPPASPEILSQHGLDGYLIDYLQGPVPVLAALCDLSRLHRTGVTLNDLGTEQFEKLQAKQSPVSTWVTNKQYFRVVRRQEYGDNAVSTTVRPVRPARIWGDQPIDHSAEQHIQDQITELRRWFAEAQKGRAEYTAEKDRLSKEIERLKTEKEDIEREKADCQRAYKAWEAIPVKIDTSQSRLEGLREEDRQVKERLAELATRRNQLVLDRGQLALDYANVVETLRKCHQSLVEAQLQHLEATSDVEYLKNRSQGIQDMLAARKREIEELQGQSRHTKAQMDEKKEEYARVVADITDEEANVHEELAGQDDMDEAKLDDEVSTLAAQIGLLHEGNPDLIRQYEQRAKDIEKYRSNLADLVANLEVTKERIQSVREEWEPQLDALIDKISDAFAHNFSKIGCAGEVGVYKADDYKEWAIQIRVKFREHEQLSILDNHRQSGGERAVSTIFYLMALQSLARSPFRVVDEINQGMDPRNERMVHERMVDIACKEHTSQYFLVTPKLLPGLKYHPRMAVHCIASGEHMPSDPTSVNLRAQATLALGLKGKA